MLFTLLASSAFAGCGNIMDAPVLTQCFGGGFRVGMATLHRLGDWRTRPCVDQCDEYLAGRSGCCYQKTNKAHCWVIVGTRKEGIYVQKGASPTQAVICDPPTYTGNEFTQAFRETNVCPGGFEPVANAADCARANNALISGVYHPVGPTHPGWSTRPGGCFLQVEGHHRQRGYVMFNNNPVGGTTEPGYTDMKICIRSTPVTAPPACPLPTCASDRGCADTSSRGCAPVGFVGYEGGNCLNGNTPYPTFSDAWEACDVEPECDMVIRWTHWSWHGYRYQMRRSGDRVIPGEGFTYSCAHQCPDGIDNIAPASEGGSWEMGARGQTCDQVCGALSKTCDATKMTCINSPDEIRDAFREAGHECTSVPDSRNYAGSPFVEKTGACYPFGVPRGMTRRPLADQGPLASVCDAILHSTHTALCYCK